MPLIRRHLLVACAAFAPLFAFAYTLVSGHAATQTRQVAEFQSIAASGDIDIQVSQCPQKVDVATDDNLLPLLETEVEGSGAGATLKVRWKRGESIHSRSKTRVTIVMPKLDRIAAAGSGDIAVDGFQTPALEVSLSGSSDAHLNAIDTRALTLRVSGSGDITAGGQATTVNASVAGSGDLRLSGLRADDVKVRIAGSGDAAVHAEKTLDVGIAGSGDVEYTGNARVSSRIAGSGSVKQK